MPIYDSPTGASSAMDFLASFIAGRNAQQQQNKQQALQEKEANARIASEQAQTKALQQRLLQEKSQQDIENKRFGLEQQQFGLQQREAGIDPTTGKPFDFGIGPKQQGTLQNPKSSPEQRQAIYSAAASVAMRNGDTKAAAQYGALAKQAADESAKAKDEALKFMQFAEKQMQDASLRSHYANQDAAAAQRNSIALGRLQIEAQDAAARIAQGQTRIQDEQTNLILRMKEFGLRTEEVKLTKQRTQADLANVASEINSRVTSRLQGAISRLHSQGVDMPTGTMQVGKASEDYGKIIADFAKADSGKRQQFLQLPSLPADLRTYLSTLNALVPPDK